ncbi:hypothetical protein HXX76_015107 [Chlamydomonas incerta]|uniref:Uncharacterized protein n=1 Tax=Chlamydomonas incerta TaxID=51695 RepID=A0A835VNU5_CHLIN|nr:hypothetical protein HXX76_015107 [Chlamydomonas incerta]|eukprot:KAG2423717.1 hypothetical protein HXX76_015107 [Chlamydomonas incerta]
MAHFNSVDREFVVRKDLDDDGTGSVTLRVRPYDGWDDVQSLIYNAPELPIKRPEDEELYEYEIEAVLPPALQSDPGAGEPPPELDPLAALLGAGPAKPPRAAEQKRANMERYREEVLQAERAVLHTLGFLLDVQHPYTIAAVALWLANLMNTDDDGRHHSRLRQGRSFFEQLQITPDRARWRPLAAAVRQACGPLAAVQPPAVNAAAAAVDSDWQEGARTGLSLAVLLLLAMARLVDGIPSAGDECVCDAAAAAAAVSAARLSWLKADPGSSGCDDCGCGGCGCVLHISGGTAGSHALHRPLEAEEPPRGGSVYSQ